MNDNAHNNDAVNYKALAMAFAYPDDAFFRCFQIEAHEREGLQAEYDRLFRTGKVWLDGAEHHVENEFQRVAELSDIMGFYHAFGMTPKHKRPDALSCELEFMHVMEVKRARAERGEVSGNAAEKAEICRDAQAKFFREHLAPTALLVAARIRETTEHPFYQEVATELAAFMARERLRHGDPVKTPVPKPRDESRIEWKGCRACQHEEDPL